MQINVTIRQALYARLPTIPRVMTFEEFWPTYEKMKALRVKGTTLSAYRLAWETRLKDYFGPIPLDAVKNSTLQTFIDQKLAEGISIKTVRDYVVVVKNMLKFWCIAQDIPCTSIIIIWPTEGSTNSSNPREKYSDKELSKLMDHCKESSEHFDKIIALAAMTGIRIGEAAGLQFGDFDFNEKTIQIRRTAGRIYNGGKQTELYVNTPKTRSSNRIIPVPAWLIRYFRDYQKLFKYTDDTYISASLAEKLPFLEPRSIRCRFKSLCEKVGIPVRTFHCLRHTYASRLLLAKTDIRTTAELLGHSDIQTTLNIYAHSDEEKKHQAAKKIFL